MYIFLANRKALVFSFVMDQIEKFMIIYSFTGEALLVLDQ